VLGHGVDVERFHLRREGIARPVRVLTVGRLSPIKRMDMLLDVLAVLKERGVAFEATIVGAASEGGSEHEDELYAQARRLGISDAVVFAGAVPNKDIEGYYDDSDIFINLSETGSVDKAVLEAMAAGVIPVTSNEAFASLLADYRDRLCSRQDAHDIADKIERLMHADDILQIRAQLRSAVEEWHSLNRLIPLIVESLGYEK
jgi:glycosyltransferase involved in cell wall biosynthesis